MDVSGTLHLYSGDDKELFFVFDDDVAQVLYDSPDIDVDDRETRRVWISVGTDRFIHRRTMNFSRKQTEIKVSLCSRASKDDLGTLTTVYDWYVPAGAKRPEPFPIIGTLDRVQHEGGEAWELHLTEPVGLIVPPGLLPRKKAPPSERKAYEARRLIVKRDTEAIGRKAEELAFELAQGDFPAPDYSCHWRDTFLDSIKPAIRKLGIIADIDVWNEDAGEAEVFLEIKAQKILSKKTKPFFHLSASEWRSHNKARKSGIPYQLWLFRYYNLTDFDDARDQIELIVYDELDSTWLDPESFGVEPIEAAGTPFDIN